MKGKLLGINKKWLCEVTVYTLIAACAMFLNDKYPNNWWIDLFIKSFFCTGMFVTIRFFFDLYLENKKAYNICTKCNGAGHIGYPKMFIEQSNYSVVAHKCFDCSGAGFTYE